MLCIYTITYDYIRTRIQKTKFVQTFQCFLAPQQLLRKVMASLPAKPFQTRRASRNWVLQLDPVPSSA